MLTSPVYGLALGSWGGGFTLGTLGLILAPHSVI